MMIPDLTYILFVMAPGMLLSFWASSRVKSAFRKYSQVRARSGLSGAEAARELIRRAGIRVRVERVDGTLSDHYDPGVRTLRLSRDVYDGRSLAALGVAAHEAGHALQHADGYAPLKFRSAIVGPAAFGSSAGMYAAMLGLVFSWKPLILLGVVLYSAFFLMTLVTLPVEFNASARAVRVLQDNGMITPDESPGTRAVLNAAALTYVAAAVSSLLTLLYLLMRSGLLGGRSED